MSRAVSSPSGTEVFSDAPRAAAFRALIETTKPGITRLVTITAAVGFALSWLSGPAGPTGWHVVGIAAACILGTALSAAGANALNQWLERDRDARMQRTRGRPLPTSRLSPAAVRNLGFILCIAGLAVLIGLCGPIPAAISFTCILSYAAVYTPLKPLTPLSTYIGTIPGALPPLIGWCAAQTDGLSALSQWGGWSLFALMTVWQLPHFFAIGWMYRDDYAAGGYRTLPNVDPTGRRTAVSIVFWAALLIPATIAPAFAMPSILGWPYIALASVAGMLFFRLSFAMVKDKSRPAARKVFLGSIAHLPLILVAMVLEALVRAIL